MTLYIHLRKVTQKLESGLLCTDSPELQFCSSLAAGSLASTLRLFLLPVVTSSRQTRRIFSIIANSLSITHISSPPLMPFFANSILQIYSILFAKISFAKIAGQRTIDFHITALKAAVLSAQCGKIGTAWRAFCGILAQKSIYQVPSAQKCINPSRLLFAFLHIYVSLSISALPNRFLDERNPYQVPIPSLTAKHPL